MPLRAVGEGREPDMALRNVISTLNHGRHGGHGPRGPHVSLSGQRHHERQPADRREQPLLRAQVARRHPQRLRDRPVPGGHAAAAAASAACSRRFYGGQSPWQYEALYVSRAKSVVKAQGLALSRELAELVYDVDYYVHVDTREDAVKLVTHMPYRRAPADHGSAERLRRPGRRAVDQPDRPGHTAGAGQREDPRDHRAGPRPPAGFPAHLRDHAQRREGAHAAARTSGCAS